MRLGTGICAARWEHLDWRNQVQRRQRHETFRKLRALEGPERRATARSDEPIISKLVACVIIISASDHFPVPSAYRLSGHDVTGMLMKA